jgi:hypothetical protein
VLESLLPDNDRPLLQLDPPAYGNQVALIAVPAVVFAALTLARLCWQGGTWKKA